MILGIIRDKSAASDTRSDSETESEDDTSKAKAVGWLYMGSHNFTPSAWGTLSGSAFNPTLNVRMRVPVTMFLWGIWTLTTGLDHELRARHPVASAQRGGGEPARVLGAAAAEVRAWEG